MKYEELKVGQRVKLVRECPNHKDGWDNNWTDEMQQNIGKEFEIKSYDQYGVRFTESAFGYPWSCLTLIEDIIPAQSSQAKTIDSHYNYFYTLTEEDIKQGKIKIDPYFVAQQWKLGSKDDSGALWHCFKTIARFGEKNPVEREIKALHKQIKRLAELNGVVLE